MEILLRNGFQSRKKNITGDMIEKMYKEICCRREFSLWGKKPNGKVKRKQ